ncbi:hypothetical protein GCM10023405_19240 [Streptomonospora salina]
MWPCGQDPHTHYSHDLTRRLITGLSRPGQAVAFLGHRDGTPLIEAARHDRRTYGVEVDPDRVHTAERRIRADLADEQRHDVAHWRGDARAAAQLRDGTDGPLALVVARLPAPGSRTASSTHRNHLGRLRGSAYSHAVGDVIAAAAGVLEPGGHAALVCGGADESGTGPDRVTACAHHAHAAGLVYLQHVIALTQPVGAYLDEMGAGAPGAGCLGPAQAQAAASVIHPAHDDVVLLRKPVREAEGEVGR